MKNRLSKLLLVVVFMGVSAVASANCRWVGAHWQGGYYYRGHQVCWQGGTVNYAQRVCGVVPGHYRNGYWFPAHRTCWYR